VAGVYGPRHDGFPTQQEFDDVMHTNVLSAMRLVPIVAPLLANSHGKLAVLSSNMGSLSARKANGASVYRASKAALNSVLVDAAITYGPQGVTCVSFHPGWVRTDMGSSDAPLSVEESVTGLRATLAQVAPSAEARFLNYDGKPLQW
jgi:NAD(P)-dependent dehydrogenase (short-subunit alcohol dehydrogenase family)